MFRVTLGPDGRCVNPPPSLCVRTTRQVVLAPHAGEPAVCSPGGARFARFRELSQGGAGAGTCAGNFQLTSRLLWRQLWSPTLRIPRVPVWQPDRSGNRQAPLGFQPACYVWEDDCSTSTALLRFRWHIGYPNRRSPHGCRVVVRTARPSRWLPRVLEKSAAGHRPENSLVCGWMRNGRGMTARHAERSRRRYGYHSGRMHQ